MAGALLKANSGISALYGQFEANGYDNADANFSEGAVAQLGQRHAGSILGAGKRWGESRAGA